MNKKRHKIAPYPWKIKKLSEDDEIEILDANDELVCTLPIRPESWGNSYLIAVAPEAVKELDENFRKNYKPEPWETYEVKE